MKKPRQIYQEVKTIKHDQGNHFVRVTVLHVDAGLMVGKIHLMVAESGPSDDWTDGEVGKNFTVLERMDDAGAQRIGIATFDELKQNKIDELFGKE